MAICSPVDISQENLGSSIDQEWAYVQLWMNF